VGTGGLSHWLCDVQEGRVNDEFDREVIEKMVSGKAAELAELHQDVILEKAGNGGLEVINWIFMAACLSGGKGELIYYEPMPEWITGMAGLAILP
jgi:hypothetical protein